MPAGVYGAALEFLRGRFHGTFRTVAFTVSVQVTATRLVGFDVERISLTFVNLSANDVYIAPSTTPTSTVGIRLQPNGGAVSVTVDEDGSLPVEEWHAIGSAAPSQVYIIMSRRDTFIEPEG